MLRRSLLLAVLLGIVPGCAVAQYGPPPPDDAPPPDGYEDEAPPPPEGYDDQAPPPEQYDDSLSPYGSWGDDPQYGRIWRPAVAYGWQPYVDGQWVWSPYGWTWVSYEPWAWTFHYGRWVYVSAFGWSWVPGYVWGPAWVDWYWGDGFVGWAPLSPFATHVTVVNQFVFVRERDFCARRLRPVLFDHRRVPDPVLRGWHRRDFRAPDHDRIERVSNHPIMRVDRRPPETIAPRGGGGRLARPGTEPRLGGARRADRGDRGLVQPRQDDGGFGRRGRDRGGDRGFVRPRQDERANRGQDDDPGRRFGRGDGRERRQPAPRLARPRLDPDLGGARRAPDAPVYPRPAAPAPGWQAPRRSQPFTPPPGRGGGERGWSRPAPPAVPGGAVTPAPAFDARGMRGGAIGRGGSAGERPRADRGRHGSGASPGLADGTHP
jgi:hypothetical protein